MVGKMGKIENTDANEDIESVQSIIIIEGSLVTLSGDAF